MQLYYKNLMILFISISISGYNGSDVTYWKEYDGEVPSDAVPGGINKQGEITFIGQALHENPNGKLIPGSISQGELGVTYYWNGNEYTATEAVKILCSSRLHDLEWLNTDNTAVKRLNVNKLVVGGYDTSYYLYIGKKFVDGAFYVGKVTIQPPYDGMCYTQNETANCIKSHYLILSSSLAYRY